MVSSRGPNMHASTENALMFRAKEMTAVRATFLVEKNVGMKASQISPIEKVEKDTYFDSLKLSGKRMVVIARALQTKRIIVS